MKPENCESKESHFLPQTSITMIQTPKASISNFFKNHNFPSNKAMKTNRSNSKKKHFPLPSRSLQNSSKRKTETSARSAKKEPRNIFENSLYGMTESNNKLSRQGKAAKQAENTPSMGHTQRSFWAKQEPSEPVDFVERAKGFNGTLMRELLQVGQQQHLRNQHEPEQAPLQFAPFDQFPAPNGFSCVEV